MPRVHNFCAGPAALPAAVLERAREELLDFAGTGVSIMEMSHRSGVFDAVIKSAEANIRELLSVPEEYAVLFLQGGASHQFAMVPANLLTDGEADYLNTGTWSAKAIREASVAGKVRVVWDGQDEEYRRMPRPEEYTLNPDAAYVHLCTNETIGGIRFPVVPQTQAPLVADMSSEILSRRIDVSQYALIYAGAQKNIGPSGLALVIMRRDLAGRAPESLPIFWRYRTFIENDSLYNTPNTWAIYLVKLVTDWLLAQGGVAAMEAVNDAKAARLYAALDSSDFYTTMAEPEWRSVMNIVFRTPSEALDAALVEASSAAGLAGLKGHRVLGGLRASLYNACPPEAVDALISFLREFERTHG